MKMKMSLILLLSIFVASQSQASDIFFEKIKTSDNIHMAYGGGRWAFRPDGWSLGVGLSESEFRNEGLDREVKMIRADVEKIWSLNDEFRTLSTRLGVVNTDSQVNDTNELMAQIRFADQRGAWTFWSSIERQNLIDQMRVTSTLGSHLVESFLTLGSVYLLTPRLKVGASVKASELSDDNSYLSYDASAMYKVVSSGWPWIWAGYGYSALDSQRLGAGYWSPRRFHAHGPRIDTSFPIYGPISGIVALNVNFYDEDGTTGDGYYLVSGLQWGRHDDTNVRITYNKIRSGQGQAPWIYEGVRVSCTVFRF